VRGITAGVLGDDDDTRLLDVLAGVRRGEKNSTKAAPLS
jgi:hypothetical protein